MRTSAILLTTFALTFGITAHAESGVHDRYKWKDAQGNLHYDDALPAEAVQFGYDVVNKSGMVVKHVDRAKTAEELKTDKEAAAILAADKKTAEEQAQHDQQMLAAYPNEQDLTRRNRAAGLAGPGSTRDASQRTARKSLTDMLGRAATWNAPARRCHRI